jgi:hypothetical protein
VDKYVLLRFAHLIGLMLMSAGLIGVFGPPRAANAVRKSPHRGHQPGLSHFVQGSRYG